MICNGDVEAADADADVAEFCAAGAFRKALASRLSAREAWHYVEHYVSPAARRS